MNVITNAPIYSNTDGNVLTDLQNQLKGKTPQEIKALKDAEKQRIKQERLTDRAKLKAERDARLIQQKEQRQLRRADRKAKRNAKRLLRLRNKEGKEKIYYPLTRLRRNKNNQIVKVYPDGKETIIKPENVVVITTQEISPTGIKSVTTELDKNEVAQALNISANQVTAELAQVKITEIKKEDAPVQANETKTSKFENVVAVEVTPENVVTDNQGNDVLATDTQNTQEKEVDVAEENKETKGEEPKGLSLTVKIVIGVVSVTLLSGIAYMIYQTAKSKN
jgi:hypothetical protein